MTSEMLLAVYVQHKCSNKLQDHIRLFIVNQTNISSSKYITVVHVIAYDSSSSQTIRRAVLRFLAAFLAPARSA